jgi:hypothetical protein
MILRVGVPFAPGFADIGIQEVWVIVALHDLDVDICVGFVGVLGKMKESFASKA